jgi:hypothetical protein
MKIKLIYKYRNEILKVKTRMAKMVLDKNKSGNEENCDPRLDKGVKENYCNSNFEYDPVKLMGN